MYRACTGKFLRWLIGAGIRPQIPVWQKSTPADLVEDQAHQRLGAADVGWRHDEVKRNRLIPLDQIVDAPVAVVGDLRDDGVAIAPGATWLGSTM